MRVSCNGCRVLRKGCSEDCILKPCLEWIESSESQANATVFLAKFYGRAGLINLINAGPDHLRPAIFKSLLFEACGRIINPIYGSVGLVSSGSWDKCQSAVDAVLKGSPIMQLSATDTEVDPTASHSIMPLKGCDIRHLSKDPEVTHRVARTRNRVKRSGGKRALAEVSEFTAEPPALFSISGWSCNELTRAPSHESFSAETVEASMVIGAGLGPQPELEPERAGEVGLELTLGFGGAV